MEDKTFDLLSKMYSELAEFRKETNQRLDKVEERLDKLEDGQQKLGNQMTRMEENHSKDSTALFDGYKVTYEKLDGLQKDVDKIDKKIDGLEQIVKNHEVQIKVIKGA